MLDVKNIKKQYNGKTVIENISFSIQEGEIVGLLGLNGAGKTTMLNIITGILNYDGGSILFDQKNVEKDLITYKKNIGLVSDVFPLYENLTGREFVAFLANLWEVPKAVYITHIDQLAKTFYMSDKLDDFIKTYSKGMKQKICLMSALVHNPKLLILDEPFNGLDPASIKEIKAFFTEYIEDGNSIIFSSHVLDIVEKICTRCLIIHNGQIITDESVENLLNNQSINADLESLFFDLTQAVQPQMSIDQDDEYA